MNVALLFPGQGAQAVGMGQEWYQSNASVRSFFDQADQVLKSHCQFQYNLSDLCFNGPADKLQETYICQPALYVMGYAIAEQLKQKHTVVAATGISLGVVTAYASAGVWDFETGLRIVAERSRLMQIACGEHSTGMLAMIGGTETQLQQLCADFNLDIANRNCPGQTAVSGLLEDLQKAQFVAEERGFKRAILLKTAGGYHSRWMQSARKGFEEFLAPIPFKAPIIPVISNTTGKPISDPEAIRKALVTQVTQTIQVEACLRYLSTLEFDVGFECGPGNVLAGLAKRTEARLCIKSAASPDVLNA